MGDLLFGRGEAGFGGFRLVAQLGQRGDGTLQALLGVAAGNAAALLGGGGILRCFFGLFTPGPCCFDGPDGGGQLFAYRSQAIALAEANGGLGGGAGANGIAVPPPDGAAA